MIHNGEELLYPGRICAYEADKILKDSDYVTPQDPFLNYTEMDKLQLRGDSARTSMSITGKRNPDDDAIFLKVQIVDKNGSARNVYFPFEIFTDTPIDVAKEMVKELDITDWDPSEIATMIEAEISMLLPERTNTYKNDAIAERNADISYPEELNMFVDKRMLFKVEVNESNLYRNWRSYTVKKMTADDEIITRFISHHGINLGNDEEEAEYVEAVSKLADNQTVDVIEGTGSNHKDENMAAEPVVTPTSKSLGKRGAEHVDSLDDIVLGEVGSLSFNTRPSKRRNVSPIDLGAVSFQGVDIFNEIVDLECGNNGEDSHIPSDSDIHFDSSVELMDTGTSGVNRSGDVIELNCMDNGEENDIPSNSDFDIQPADVNAFSNITNSEYLNIGHPDHMCEDCGAMMWYHERTKKEYNPPMMHKHCFEALDRTLRDVMKSFNNGRMDIPFGGKVVVLGGDFRQILPVIPKGTREEIAQATVNFSHLWNYVEVLTLTTNMRLSTGSSDSDIHERKLFSEWILAIGDGSVGESNDVDIRVEIPHDLLLRSNGDPLAAIVNITYPNLLKNIDDLSYFQDRAILAPKNAIVDEVNNYMMDLMPGEEKIYLSYDSPLYPKSGNNSSDEVHTPEFLNTIAISGIPNHKLRLKVGVPVMLLRNIDHNLGLCNGTRLVITKMGKCVLEGKVISGTNIGQKVYIPRLSLAPSDKKIPVKFQRRQFPLAVSFAMTINKSQGQSLKHVGVYLPQPVFSHGQLYVALSRVTSRKGLKVLVLDDEGNDSNVTSNVVYKEIFQNLL